MANWKEIDTCNVRHIYTCPDGKCDDVDVYPDYFFENGTPVCQCDKDMEYSRTEIRTQ